MRQRLLTLLAVASVPLLFGMAFLWVRSYQVGDGVFLDQHPLVVQHVTPGYRVLVRSSGGGLLVGVKCPLGRQTQEEIHALLFYDAGEVIGGCQPAARRGTRTLMPVARARIRPEHSLTSDHCWLSKFLNLPKVAPSRRTARTASFSPTHCRRCCFRSHRPCGSGDGGARPAAGGLGSARGAATICGRARAAARSAGTPRIVKPGRDRETGRADRLKIERTGS